MLATFPQCNFWRLFPEILEVVCSCHLSMSIGVNYWFVILLSSVVGAAAMITDVTLYVIDSCLLSYIIYSAAQFSSVCADCDYKLPPVCIFVFSHWSSRKSVATPNLISHCNVWKLLPNTWCCQTDLLWMVNLDVLFRCETAKNLSKICSIKHFNFSGHYKTENNWVFNCYPLPHHRHWVNLDVHVSHPSNHACFCSSHLLSVVHLQSVLTAWLLNSCPNLAYIRIHATVYKKLCILCLIYYEINIHWIGICEVHEKYYLRWHSQYWHMRLFGIGKELHVY